MAAPAELKDIINYTPDTYFTDDELSFIRSSFNGPQGNRLLKLVRKMMIPTISDPNLPIEEMGQDLWMGVIDFKMMPEAEVKSIVVGLQVATKAIMGGLINIKRIANVKDESPQNREARRAKDSDK